MFNLKQNSDPSGSPIVQQPSRIIRDLVVKMWPIGLNLPKPANDNHHNLNDDHSKASRDEAGSTYQPAATKMWWLP